MIQLFYYVKFYGNNALAYGKYLLWFFGIKSLREHFVAAVPTLEISFL